MLNFNKALFGQRLHQIREERGSTRKELSELLGISRTQVSDMENGKSGTSLDRLYFLCQYYQVSADYLLGLTDDPAWRGKPLK